MIFNVLTKLTRYNDFIIKIVTNKLLRLLESYTLKAIFWIADPTPEQPRPNFDTTRARGRSSALPYQSINKKIPGAYSESRPNGLEIILVRVIFVSLFGCFSGRVVVLATLVERLVVPVHAGGLHGRSGIGAAQQVGETAERAERAERAQGAGLAEELREGDGGGQGAAGGRARAPPGGATLQVRLL